MTIVEQATADAVDQWQDDGVDLLSGFLGAFRERLRAWLDAHAEDVVVRVFGLFAVRVKHVRAFVLVLVE